MLDRRAKELYVVLNGAEMGFMRMVKAWKEKEAARKQGGCVVSAEW